MHRHARKMICGVFVFCAMSALMAQEQTFTVLGDFKQTVYGAATPLVQGRDGNFYGTTVEGISSPNCINQGGLVCGAIYRVTPGGKVTWLHQFLPGQGLYGWVRSMADSPWVADGAFWRSGTVIIRA